MTLKFVSQKDKNMSQGNRDMSRVPLTNSEIEFVKSEIERIQADESIFIFNDEGHIHLSTCYNYNIDRVFVTKNVFPDTIYGSTHPRDIMSVGAVLAHEYYGHRHYRDEYLSDDKRGRGFHTTPIWQDECRASITAAKLAPGLTQQDQRDLVMDAIYRAHEFGQYIEMDNFMKEVVYGYSDGEKNITPMQQNDISKIVFVSENSAERILRDQEYHNSLPEVWDTSKDDDDREW